MEKPRCWNCGAVTKIVGRDADGEPEYKCPKCGCTLIARHIVSLTNFKTTI